MFRWSRTLAVALALAGAGPTAAQESLQRNLLEQDLPSWLELGFEVRVRGESRENLIFVEGFDDGFGLIRSRVNVGVRPSDRWRFQFQIQDSRVPGLSPDRPNGFARRPVHLRQGYFDFGAGGDQGPWRIRFGRQEVKYGEERVLGRRNWNNVSSTWDGARGFLRSGRNQVDVFTMSRVSDDDEFFEDFFNGAWLHGAYGSFGSVIPKGTVEPYVIYTTRPFVGGDRVEGERSKAYTTGFRLFGDAGAGLDYEVELAGQRGQGLVRKQRAWMGVGQLGYRLPVAEGLRFSGQFDYASGDGDQADDRAGTYDAQFAARHRLLGIADVVGRRNLKALRVGAELQPTRKILVTLDRHEFWAASARDALYAPNGLPVVAPPAGGAGSARYGDEWDLILTFTPAEELVLEGGVGRFFPGGYLDHVPQRSIRQTVLYVFAEFVM